MSEAVDDELAKKRAQRFATFEVHNLLKKCAMLYKCGIFEQNQANSPLFEPAVTQLLIWMNDLLQRADDEGNRLTLTDEMEPNTGDITDLISKMRNVACHMKSKNTALDFGSVRFVVLVGKISGIKYGDDDVAFSAYEDEVAVYFGKYRLYLKRQASRALDGLIAHYKPAL